MRSRDGSQRPTFLKLGGALLTHKDRAETLRPGVLRRLASEVASWSRVHPGRLVLGHGSGSFGHAAVRTSGFLDRPEDPIRMAYVAAAAQRLNRHVVAALLAAQLPALALPGVTWATAEAGELVEVRAELVAWLLERGFLPVVYGDAVLDRVRGGAVASTEALLVALAAILRPQRVILATDVDGVYASGSWKADRPATDEKPLELITPAQRQAWTTTGREADSQRDAVDVTGGMVGKVRAMLDLLDVVPDVEVRILSGLRPGAVAAALAGQAQAGGTVIRAR